jgi:hypothetical protein
MSFHIFRLGEGVSQPALQIADCPRASPLMRSMPTTHRSLLEPIENRFPKLDLVAEFRKDKWTALLP